MKDGGVIIMLARCNDGHGGQDFYDQMTEEDDLSVTNARLLARGRNETLPDQWMTQILIRILQRSSVIYVSDAPDELISGYHLIPAHTLEEAMQKAEGLLQNPNATITAIPDGVSVMVLK